LSQATSGEAALRFYGTIRSLPSRRPRAVIS
jgi:hypothetical protein